MLARPCARDFVSQEMLSWTRDYYRRRSSRSFAAIHAADTVVARDILALTDTFNIQTLRMWFTWAVGKRIMLSRHRTVLTNRVR